MDDDELFELVRKNYSEVNKEYIQEQIGAASEYLTDEQKEELRKNTRIFFIEEVFNMSGLTVDDLLDTEDVEIES